MGRTHVLVVVGGTTHYEEDKHYSLLSSRVFSNVLSCSLDSITRTQQYHCHLNQIADDKMSNSLVRATVMLFVQKSVIPVAGWGATNG